MGVKTVLVIYEDKEIPRASFTAKDVVSTFEDLQKKDKYEIKDYSFENFAEKDDGDVKCWKAVIIINDTSNWLQKVLGITKKFDQEQGLEYRVFLTGEPTLPEDGPITSDHVIATPDMADILTWWPHMLRFLFPRKQKLERPLRCLLLFNGNESLIDADEARWYIRMDVVLRSLGMECQWIADADQSPAPDVVVAMSRFGGVGMHNKSVRLFNKERETKTILLTDDAHSKVCKSLKKVLKKVYLYPTENPLELSFLGWSMLLRELKLIECKDLVFKQKRSKKKILFIVSMLIFLFVVLPFVLAVIAALVFLCVFGVDVGKIVDCCCQLTSCCGMCGETCAEVPLCIVCMAILSDGDGKVLVIDDD